MTTLRSILTLGFASFGLAQAHAAPAKPIPTDVFFKSNAFAEAVMTSLWKTTEPTRYPTAGGGWIYEIRVANGLACQLLMPGENPRFPDMPSTFRCALLKTGGWSVLGMEAYGSGNNPVLSAAIYDALSAREIKETAFSVKSIELNRPDGRGGTERNGISCIKPTLEGQKLGMRATCQILNAL